MRRRDWIASLVLCGLGLAVAARSFRLGLGTWGEPGPGFFPFWAAVLFGSLAFAGLLQALVGRPMPAPPWQLRGQWRLAVLVAVLAAYAVSLEPAGFLLSTFALLLVLFRLMGSRGVVRLVAGSGVISVVVYSVFKFWLGVQLPSGPIRF